MTALGAVVFDWGGTLAVHQPVELLDLWRTAARILSPEDEESLTQRLVAVDQRVWARTLSTMRSVRLMDIVREASEEVGLDVAQAVISAAQDAHLDDWTRTITHHVSAREVLLDARERALAVGLLSNTHWPRSYHEHFLTRDGLIDLFDARLYTCEIDWMKPHPEPFESIAYRLDTPMEACLFVGDRPVDDIQGAADVGMQTVWIANDHAPGDGTVADHVIDDLSQLPALLERLTDPRRG